MSKYTNYDIIRSPVVTEKSTLASEHSQVVFDVAIDATKPQIKDAVKKAAHKDIAIPGSFKPAAAAVAAEESK